MYMLFARDGEQMAMNTVPVGLRPEDVELEQPPEGWKRKKLATLNAGIVM